MTHLEEQLKKKLRETEGELSIIKGIGNNSPEMRDAKKEIEALKKEIDLLRDQAQINRLESDKAYSTNTTLLERINNLQTVEKEHKKYVGDLLKELDSYKDKLQKLINDPNSLRKLGVY
ncbi:chemotaxis protein [uncultured Mediterranean phage]|nr:chemotaxis protein [uncultured Mediterranean phage]